MESEWVDFKEIKRAVSIEMVLVHYNIALRRVNRESLRGPCPLPSHSAKGEQTMCVNITKNIWACQSSSCVKARQGRKGGNVLDLVAVIESCSIRDAALKLANWFGVSRDGERISTPNKKVQPGTSQQPVAQRADSEEGEVTNWCTYKSVENKAAGVCAQNRSLPAIHILPLARSRRRPHCAFRFRIFSRPWRSMTR